MGRVYVLEKRAEGGGSETGKHICQFLAATSYIINASETLRGSPSGPSILRDLTRGTRESDTYRVSRNAAAGMRIGEGQNEEGSRARAAIHSGIASFPSVTLQRNTFYVSGNMLANSWQRTWRPFDCLRTFLARAMNHRAVNCFLVPCILITVDYLCCNDSDRNCYRNCLRAIVASDSYPNFRIALTLKSRATEPSEQASPIRETCDITYLELPCLIAYALYISRCGRN